MGWLLFGVVALSFNVITQYCERNYKIAILTAVGLGFLVNTLLKLFVQL